MASYAHCLEPLKELFDSSSKQDMYLADLIGWKKASNRGMGDFRKGSEAVGGVRIARPAGGREGASCSDPLLGTTGTSAAWL